MVIDITGQMCGAYGDTYIRGYITVLVRALVTSVESKVSYYLEEVIRGRVIEGYQIRRTVILHSHSEVPLHHDKICV